MHHNDNHGNWLALTSAGVRQAKADMVPSMSTRNQLDGAPFLPTGERRNLLHVIYQQANSQTTTESDVLNKLPIPLNFSFDGISRSTHLIENTSPQRYLELSTAKGNHLLTGKQSQSWFESSPEDSSTTASPNSHRPKRETFQLDNHSRMVIMMPRDTHRMMILNDTKIIAKALPNDSNPSCKCTTPLPFLSNTWSTLLFICHVWSCTSCVLDEIKLIGINVFIKFANSCPEGSLVRQILYLLACVCLPQVLEHCVSESL